MLFHAIIHANLIRIFALMLNIIFLISAIIYKTRHILYCYIILTYQCSVLPDKANFTLLKMYVCICIYLYLWFVYIHDIKLLSRL